MTTVERIDQIYEKMQAFPLSNILPLVLPIALESRDYEGYCILSYWLNPITKEKDANFVLWSGIERILLQEGIDKDSANRIKSKSFDEYMKMRTVDKDSVLCSSVKEIEDMFKSFDDMIAAVELPQGLHPVDLYYRSQTASKEKFVVIEKPNSMEIIHTILHPIFQTAVRDCYIRLNPSDGVMTEIKKSHNWEKPKRHALTKSQQAAFIDYVRGHKVYSHWLPLITVLIGTGCRVGEIVGLRWDDCDFQNGIIEINHNLIYRPDEQTGKCCYHITTPKTKKGIREVPMFSDVRRVLNEERIRQMRDGFNQEVIDGYSGFIFSNRNGNVMNAHNINRALERIIRDFNSEEAELAKKEQREPELLPHFSVHNLRHTFCNRMCENETNLKIIQEIMGHADISTTMNIYNEATREQKQQSFANLEGKIKIS